MSAPPLDAAAREAIRWMVLLQGGEASPEERQRFNAWLGRDERHRAAWHHLNGPVADVLAPVRAFNQQAPGRAQAMAAALVQAKTRLQRRRQALKGALALGGIGAGTAALLQRFAPLQHTFADVHTATGQRRRFALADGSALLLDARSAADVQFTPERRQVTLRAGALIADVLPGRQRPFCLASAHGEVQPLDAGRPARLLVRQQAQGCLVAALGQPLRITPRHGTAVELPSGGTASLSAQSVRPALEEAVSAAAWESGRVTVYDRPLGEVIDALRAYRAGFLRIAPAAAALKVYGSYPLDDTDEALRSIAETLPVAVHVHSGGWLVRIELA